MVLVLAGALVAGCVSRGPGTSNSMSTSTLSPAEAPTTSGEPMPLGDLAGWRQIFADDFETPVPLGSFPDAVSTKWWAYPDGWKDTSRKGTYYPSKVVSIAEGIMNLHLHTENGITMVAAPVPRLPGQESLLNPYGRLYGRYAVRFRADPAPGFKTAWLLWPDSETWPRDGEINLPEGNLDGRICGFLHHQGGTSAQDQDVHCTDATFSSWHTAIIEWTPAVCRFIVDGVTIGSSRARVPNTSMHWVIQTETALEGPAPTHSANVQIDWVAVWAPAAA